MDQQLKTEWLAALRGGEYKQVQGYLKAPREDGEMGYCCLGVLCDVLVKRGEGFEGFTLKWSHVAEDAGVDRDHYDLQVRNDLGILVDEMAGSLPFRVEEHFDVSSSITDALDSNGEQYYEPITAENKDGDMIDHHTLIDLNDSAGWDFNQIADVIEERF